MSGKNNQLVPVRKTDLVVGEPAPWPVYDGKNNLLLNRGTVIQSQKQLDVLYSQGLYRDPRWEVQQRKMLAASRAAQEAAPRTPPPPRKQDDLVACRFSEMKLKPGDGVQLQELTGEKGKHVAKIVGFLDGVSLVVTNPVRDGKPVPFLDRQPFIVRTFSGRNAFAFESQILRAYPAPFPHLHLASPKGVKALEVRGAERIACAIIAAVSREGDAEKRSQAAVIVDLSVTGARLTAKEALGKKDETIIVAFRCESNATDEYLTLKGVIRQIGPEAPAQEGAAPEVGHGVQFVDLQSSERLVLENTIFRRLLEEG